MAGEMGNFGQAKSAEEKGNKNPHYEGVFMNDGTFMRTDGQSGEEIHEAIEADNEELH